MPFVPDQPTKGRFVPDEPPEKAAESVKPRSKTGFEEGGIVDQFYRMGGLTGRALVEGNPYVAIGDVLASPIRVLGNAIRPGTFTQTGGEAMADLLGLPKPENKTESVIQALSQATAGSAGAPLLAKLVPHVSGLTKEALKWLADKPMMQLDSALGSTGASLIAQDAGAGQAGQMAAAIAGGMAGPGVTRLTKAIAKPVMDAGAVAGAAFGNKRATNRIATDAVNRGVGSEKARVRSALNQATEYVPGAKPTVAEAIAEANLKSPDQFGGWLVRLQKDLTGARGVEDVLPTVAKEQKAAVRSAYDTANAELWPKGQQALSDAKAGGGVASKPLMDRINTLLERPDAKVKGSLVKTTLEGTKAKISDLISNKRASGHVFRGQSRLPEWVTRNKNGTINPEELYALRKVLGKDIAGYQRDSNTWDKTVSIGLERDIQKAIDDSIETAGGAGWKENYMEPYAGRMKAVSNQIARQKEVKRIGAEVKPTGAINFGSTEAPKPATLLNRKMMFVNYGLKMLGQNANDPVVKEVTARLKDPKAFAELLARPDKDPLKAFAMESARRGQVAAALSQQNGE